MVVATLLQPVKQSSIITSQQNYQVEPTFWEKVAAMELENNPASLRHERLELVTYHIFVELGHIEFFVPGRVQLLRVDQFGQLDVLEARKVVVFG